MTLAHQLLFFGKFLVCAIGLEVYNRRQLRNLYCSQAMRDLQQACKLVKSEACEMECEASYQSEDD